MGILKPTEQNIHTVYTRLRFKSEFSHQEYACHLVVNSCFDKGCPTLLNVKAYATIPFTIMSSNSLAFLDRG